MQLTFRSIRPCDAPSIQALGQGNGRSLPFNLSSRLGYVAERNGQIAGYMFGSIGLTNESHILTICDVYLRESCWSEENLRAMQESFLDWVAHDQHLYTTHWRPDALATPIAMTHPVQQTTVVPDAAPVQNFILA